MAFSTAEREFLRVAADASVTHEELAPLASADLDWDYVLDTARYHQLDGVVYWRLLSEPMEPIVPAAVREAAQRNRDYLELTCAPPWRADWQIVKDELERLGIPYVMTDGPIPYAEYPLEFWPRGISDIDTHIHPDYCELAWSELPKLGTVLGLEWSSIRLSLPNGTKFQALGFPPVTQRRWGALFGDYWLFDNAIEDFAACGITSRVSAPAARALQAAAQEYVAITEGAEPLALFALAKIHNLAVRNAIPDTLLKGLLAREQERIALQEATGRLSRPGFETSYLYGMGRMLAVVKRVYDSPLPSLTALDDFVAARCSTPQRFHYYPSAAKEDDIFAQVEVYEWASEWPDDETFIFDWYGDTPADRVSRGLWAGPLATIVLDDDLPPDMPPYMVRVARTEPQDA